MTVTWNTGALPVNCDYIIFNFLILFNAHVNFAYMCMRAPYIYMLGALRGQKRTLEPLKLESCTVVSCQVDAGN